MTPSKDIRQHLCKAGKIASAEVERLARGVLLNDPRLHEFVMGMGVWFFTLSEDFCQKNKIDITYNNFGHGDTLPGTDGEKIKCERLANFIDKWDNDLKITGEPMRFTANGKIIRNW